MKILLVDRIIVTFSKLIEKLKLAVYPPVVISLRRLRLLLLTVSLQIFHPYSKPKPLFGWLLAGEVIHRNGLAILLY